MSRYANAPDNETSVNLIKTNGLPDRYGRFH